MNRPDIHIGDVGTEIVMTIINRSTKKPVSLSAATTLEIIFQPPSGDAFKRTAEMIGTGATGQMRYILVASDIEIKGTWHIQAYAESATSQWHSDIEEFEVGDNITVPDPVP